MSITLNKRILSILGKYSVRSQTYHWKYAFWFCQSEAFNLELLSFDFESLPYLKLSWDVSVSISAVKHLCLL